MVHVTRAQKLKKLFSSPGTFTVKSTGIINYQKSFMGNYPIKLCPC